MAVKKTKTVLILGAKGNLGSQIVNELKKSGFGNVIAWSRTDCDLMDLNMVEEKIKKVSPSTIINTVAYNDVDACEHNLIEQQKAIRLNIQLVESLSCVCQNMGAQLIHFSTNYVFSGSKDKYSEFDVTSPINFYGMTKQMGEEVILSNISKGLKGSIVRVSNLFGPAGESTLSKPSFFESISRISVMRDSLNIINDEKNCFTYTKDIAREVIKVVGDIDFKGIYHFVNSNPLTWYEAAKIYFELKNEQVRLNPVDSLNFKRAANRPKSAVLEVTRSIPMRSFQIAMSEYIQSLD